MDPWDWDVDDVVVSFCHSRVLWADRPKSRCPVAQELEHSFRNHGIDGATLLLDVDLKILKDELGINQMGERSTIMHGIQKLRNQSAHYIAHQASILSRESRIHDMAGALSPTPTPPRTLAAPGTLPEQQNFHPSLESEALPVNVRSGEIVVQSVQGGKKRRKLLLGPEHTVSKSKEAEESSNAYFGRAKLSLDDIFFESLAEGELSDPESLDDFSMISSQSRQEGLRSFIDRRLRCLFHGDSLELSDKRVVKYPYPEELVKTGNPRSVLLFQEVDGHVRATKRDALMLDVPLEDMPTPDGVRNETNEWDFLAKWIKNDTEDTVLPLLGDSGSENDYDSSLLEEYAQEQEERIAIETQKDQYMGKEAVNAVIDDAITLIKKRWAEERLPKLQLKACSIWRQAQGRSRSLIMEKSRVHLSGLESRLNKLRQSITDEVWRTPLAINKQCSCMDLTVFDQQDEIWKLRLWGGKQPSSHQRAVQKPKIRQTVPRDSDEDGDLVDMDSDGIDDFIQYNSINEMTSNEPARNGSPHMRSATPYSVPVPSPFSSAIRNSPQSVVRSRTSSPKKSGSTSSIASIDSVLGNLKSGHVANDTNNSTATSEQIASTAGKVNVEKAVEYIDLTDLPTSPVDEDFKNDDLPKFSHTPEFDSKEQVAGWSWDELEERNDRKRLVMKILYSMDEQISVRILKRFLTLIQPHLMEESKRALNAIYYGQAVKAGVVPSNFDDVCVTSRLFVCWTECNRRYQKGHIPRAIVNTVEMAGRGDFLPFYEFMKVLAQHASESESESSATDAVTPRRRARAREVKRLRHGQELRQTAQQRRIEGEVRQKQLKLNMQSSGLLEDAKGVMINDTKREDEEPIYINTHISSRIKAHQIEGVRFMWRELVTVGQSVMQGCLLAHTMGLGKTMQAITILVTIAEAAMSGKSSIVEQIPKPLRTSKTLILCPPGLIENWKDEFRAWQPQDTRNVGKVFEIASCGNKDSRKPRARKRLAVISDWYTNGGILILGYSMFRNLLNNQGHRVDKEPALSEEQHQLVEMQLLEGPNIIVADEAHTLKNTNSVISKAARRFKSASRIALTASPLANNLQDYYAMIDWIAPGYLGDPVEFRAYYQEPIEAGTYAESSVSEVRKSLKKLAALKQDIDPKVNRADITVLKGALKPKVEFVIKLPLTPLQNEAYSIFVKSVLEHDTESANTRIWDWIAVLGLLLNHPQSFLKKLKKREAIRRQETNKTPGQPRKLLLNFSASKTAIPEPDEILPEDVDITQLELSDKMVKAQVDLFTQLGTMGHDHPQLSNKTAIVKEILLQCKRIGDQTLIFTHHIPTLDYLERFIKTISPAIHAVRLDGKTSMEDRLTRAKDFNCGKYDVFLISTRAGGLGLNIPRANRVILMDFNFNPTHEEQAIGRAYRIGQQKPVFVYHLVTGGTFEETVLDMAVFKTHLAARVVDKKTPARSATKARDFLFLPRPVEQQDLTEFKGKDEVLDAILDGPENMIRTLSTTETLHAETYEKLTEEELKEVEEMVKDDYLRKTNNAVWKSKNEARQAEDTKRNLGYSASGAYVPTQMPQPADGNFKPRTASPPPKENLVLETNQPSGVPAFGNLPGHPAAPLYGVLRLEPINHR